MITYRLLPVEEWGKLRDAGVEPFASQGLPEAAQAQHWLFLIAEQDGRILGCSSLVETVQNHWWIAPEARRNPILIQGLWQHMEDVLQSYGVSALHTTVPDAQVGVQAMLERLGYQPAPGTLYIIPVGASILSRKE